MQISGMVHAHEVLATQVLEPPQVRQRLQHLLVRRHVETAPVGPVVPVAADPTAIVRAHVGQVVRAAADPAALVRALVGQVVRVAADPAAERSPIAAGGL